MVFTWPPGRAVATAAFHRAVRGIGISLGKECVCDTEKGPDITYAYDFNESITWHTNG